jgi:hypothetical protein
MEVGGLGMEINSSIHVKTRFGFLLIFPWRPKIWKCGLKGRLVLASLAENIFGKERADARRGANHEFTPESGCGSPLAFTIATEK